MKLKLRKRKFKRSDVCSINAECAADDSSFFALIKNISKGGLCFHAPVELDPGQKVNLNFRLFHKFPSLRDIECEIKWRKENNLYGLKYKGVEPEKMELIEKYIAG
jgi:hypothetical protein